MRIISILSSLFFAISMCGQESQIIQAFNFDSETRDSMIQFPTGDHNNYYKIKMLYTMRCKDGLVSSGADRNRGCGEWDYSCNTSIIDSTIIDSTKAVHPNYIISGFDGDVFDYTTTPTYTYYEFELQETDYVGSGEVAYNYNSQASEDIPLSSSNKRMMFLYDADDFGLSGNTTLSSMQFEFEEWDHSFEYLKIKLATTDKDQLSVTDLESLDFQEVYYNNVTANGNTANLHFYNSFSYDASQQLVVELSYDVKEDTGTTALVGTEENENTALYSQSDDGYIDLNGTYNTEIPTIAMESISDEITVCFWAYGNQNVLPDNTVMFHAWDENEDRQLTVHLPWSDSNIYWDCGNDGDGYDRISKTANANEIAGQWNHWAFTKDANSGVMSIILNGELWHSAGDRFKPLNIDRFSIGSFLDKNRHYNGYLDDFMVWDKALTAEEIDLLRFQLTDDSHPNFNNLVTYYNFNEGEGMQILDQSNFGNHAEFDDNPIRNAYRGNQLFKNFTIQNNKPKIGLSTENLTINVNENIILDSIQNPPNKIVEYAVVNTDIEGLDPLYYWEAGDMPIFNEQGEIINYITVPSENQLYVFNLDYYQKSPAKFELLSFVTPYGIGLDFGDAGKTWEFDVTDFGPILKGSKRLRMDRGGEWQEDIDIKFVFIEGTPTRNVIEISQVWPINSVGFQNLINNSAFEPRTFKSNSGVDKLKLRVAITGHGQQGEFIPRNHFVNLDGGTSEFSWQVWNECSDNPVYPQGGTWIYDRAGWCPGAPTIVNEWDITDVVDAVPEFLMDYGISSATGTSNYIINIQLVEYGPPNYTHDVAIDRIISPTKEVEFTRLNPICDNAVISIKNEGSEPLTSALIRYGVDGRELLEYTWNGNLAPLETTEVALPAFGEGRWNASNQFIAKVSSPNGNEDENPANNTRQSEFFTTDYIFEDFLIQMKTNIFQNETKWFLYDAFDNVVASKNSNLAPNTTYTDTLVGLNGCYRLQFVDSDQDGISWWANNDGNGYIKVRSSASTWTTLEPDFGQEITYRFNTGEVTSTENQELTKSIRLYPNPASSFVDLEFRGFTEKIDISIYNAMGQLVHQQRKDRPAPQMDRSSMNLNFLDSGTYWIHFYSDEEQHTKKLIIVK